MAVPTTYLLPIPDGVAMRDAALVEPMVTTLEGIKRTAPTAGEEVLIVGSATLGLAGAMILSARGIRTHVLLRSDVRVATVEATGAIPWLAGSRAAVEKFDVVLEAAGTPSGVQAALAHAAPGGRVALLGVPTVPVEIDAGASRGQRHHHQGRAQRPRAVSSRSGGHRLRRGQARVAHRPCLPVR